MSSTVDVRLLVSPAVRRRYPFERLLARLGAPQLDRRLIAGEDASTHPLLVARAAQLAGGRVRRATAAAWQRVVDEVTSTSRGLTAAVPVCLAQVRDALSELVAMVARLCDDRPVWPVGVARARRLLLDGGGPLYDRTAPPGELRRRARLVLAELDMTGEGLSGA
jgi:hypothetical protein